LLRSCQPSGLHSTRIMLACQGSKRDKYTNALYSTSARQKLLLYCVSAGRSLVFYWSAGLARSFLLTGLPIIFKPVLLSRVLPDQFRNSFLFPVWPLSLRSPVFWGEDELYSFAGFCQGYSQNSFFSFGPVFSFSPFLTARRNYMQMGQWVKI